MRTNDNGDIMVPSSRDEMEEMIKKASIGSHQLNDCSASTGILVTEEDIKDDIQRCDKAFREISLKKEQLQKAQKFISELPFKAGDAAFHRNLGNVLVQGVLFNSGDHDNSSYVILMTSGKRGQIPLNELVPISEATKVLYGR